MDERKILFYNIWKCRGGKLDGALEHINGIKYDLILFAESADVIKEKTKHMADYKFINVNDETLKNHGDTDIPGYNLISALYHEDKWKPNILTKNYSTTEHKYEWCNRRKILRIDSKSNKINIACVHLLGGSPLDICIKNADYKANLEIWLKSRKEKLLPAINDGANIIIGDFNTISFAKTMQYDYTYKIYDAEKSESKPYKDVTISKKLEDYYKCDRARIADFINKWTNDIDELMEANNFVRIYLNAPSGERITSALGKNIVDHVWVRRDLLYYYEINATILNSNEYKINKNNGSVNVAESASDHYPIELSIKKLKSPSIEMHLQEIKTVWKKPMSITNINRTNTDKYIKLFNLIILNVLPKDRLSEYINYCYSCECDNELWDLFEAYKFITSICAGQTATITDVTAKPDGECAVILNCALPLQMLNSEDDVDYINCIKLFNCIDAKKYIRPDVSKINKDRLNIVANHMAKLTVDGNETVNIIIKLFWAYIRNPENYPDLFAYNNQQYKDYNLVAVDISKIGGNNHIITLLEKCKIANLRLDIVDYNDTNSENTLKALSGFYFAILNSNIAYL